MRRKEAGFVAAQAVIFAAVIALVSLPLQSINDHQISTSSAVAAPLAFTSEVSPQGLQLEVTLNSSSILSHGAISGKVDVLNTLNRNVSLSGLVQDQNISEWGGHDYVCDPSFFVGFGLFRGHFDTGNISAAGPPLQLAPPVAIPCAASQIPGAVTFLPDGDQAVAMIDLGQSRQESYPVTVSVNATTGYCASVNGGGIDCFPNPGLVGYWNSTIPGQPVVNFTSPAFVYFPTGEYTIAATDLWNQYVYATFVVEPPRTTTFASGASPDGLQLELMLNATTMRSDGAITGQVVVVNTSDKPVTVSTLGRSQNVTEWSNYNNICPSDYFMGYAVFGGHFTAANVSSAGTPLRLVPPMFPQCPGVFGPSKITFLPSRGQATSRVVDPGEPSNLVPDQLNATTLFCNTTEASQNGSGCDWATPGLVGYWNWSIPEGDGANFGFTSPAFFHFSPGEYTIVAWDDWNQYVYVTFVVQPANTSLTSSATSDVAACGVGSQVIELNNTEYCADEVANDTVIGSPGYSYFRNDSITFEGVRFQTFCPSTYQGCPGANSSASPVTLGVMRFTMTFPDGTNETDSSVIADGYYALILSNHSDPRAGMLIEITYGAHATTHVYLLSSLDNPNSCPINVTFFGETVPAVPAGPTTKITLENVGNSSIIRVNATLDLWNSFVQNQSGSLPHYHTYVFATVNGTNPLYPEQSISRTDVIINAIMAEGSTYQLTIRGELQDGSQFQCSTNAILSS